MTDEPITHTSASKTVKNYYRILETTNKNGVKCDWSGIVDYSNTDGLYEFSLSWNFDWRELEYTGVDGLSGYITVTSPDNSFNAQTVNVDLTTNMQQVTTLVNSILYNTSEYSAIFEYHLIPHRAPIPEESVLYDEMFLPSEKNDAVLVIDEKKLHVNKGFLSTHSDYFTALFSSKFKEGQMNEIPIKDITFEDFGLLMSTIYPKTVFPNDKTVEKLLELADRFLIPSVIGHVEYHLLHNSRITNEKKILMADQYGMPKLFEKCLRELNTLEKAKKLNTSPEYEKLSKDAKSTLLDRLMKLIQLID